MGHAGIEWAAFFPAAVLVAATPGANQLLSLRNGLRHGWAPAVSASLGRFAAFALMVAAVAAGLGAALAASEVAFAVIKWCGVAYLSWLGARTLLTAARRAPGTEPEAPEPKAPEPKAPEPKAPEPGEPEGEPAAPEPWRLARQEFLVAASNPKALVLFTAFLPQFLAHGAEPAAVPLLVLGAAYIAVEFCCAFGYAAAGSRLRSTGISRRGRRALDGLTGAAMLGLAGWLATEQR